MNSETIDIETTTPIDISGGWYMAFDLASETPYFWNKDVNDGATTWNRPWPNIQYTKKKQKGAETNSESDI